MDPQTVNEGVVVRTLGFTTLANPDRATVEYGVILPQIGNLLTDFIASS